MPVKTEPCGLASNLVRVIEVHLSLFDRASNCQDGEQQDDEGNHAAVEFDCVHAISIGQAEGKM